MPELPEVETIARQLQVLVRGRTVEDFRSSWLRLTEPVPAEHLAQRLRGRRIEGVRRRGKFVVFDLDAGDALVVSLRMTGQLLFGQASDAPDGPHVRGVIGFDDGTALRFADTRKFGRMLLVDRADIAAERGAGSRVARAPLHSSLGREPLGRTFTAAWLAAFLRRRGRAAIKPLLLDQRGIAGIGNIYAIEALWRARIHPLRQAGSLGPDEALRLREALRWVLRRGIRLGGASRRDYLDARGNAGGMQREFQVYGRAGEPCPRCGRAIVRTVVGGRGTFHCPGCQRAPAKREATTRSASLRAGPGDEHQEAGHRRLPSKREATTRSASLRTGPGDEHPAASAAPAGEAMGDRPVPRARSRARERR